MEHRPGDGVTVGYRVWVRDPAGAASEEYVLLSSSAGHDVLPQAPALARLDGPGGRLLAWRHPDDPALPALRAACDPHTLEPLLPGTGPVTGLELVGYRPLRRAVLRAVRGGRTTYVKVLRPGPGRGGATEVLERHTRLAAAGLPVPRVLADDPAGLVVLAALPGIPLVRAIAEDDAAGFDLAAVLALLDSLPPDVLDLPRRRPWSERADAYADALEAAGAHGPRARAVARAVLERSRALDLGPVVPVHGDLHEGQLSVERTPGASRAWRVVGLLDVDTVGPGHRVDDLACLLAHAVALGEPGRVVAARWEEAARQVVDEAALAVRTAGVLLSLAAGAAHGRGPTAPGALLDEAERRLQR